MKKLHLYQGELCEKLTPNFDKEMEVGKVYDIHKKYLQINPDNYRKTYDDDKLKELMVNMEKGGQIHEATVVLQKIKTVSANGKDKYGSFRFKFMPIVGNRRLAAVLKSEKIETLRCRYLVLTEEEILEMMISENLIRQDVHPLDEMEAFLKFRTQKNWTLQEIASRLGKSIPYVVQRVQLSKLNKKAKELLQKDIINISIACELSRLESNYQNELIKKCTSNLDDDTLVWTSTLRDLKRIIKNGYTLELKKAGFNLSDENLYPDAGACLTCPKNTACNASLFIDFNDDSGRCTDKKCFDKKSELYKTKMFAHYQAEMKKKKKGQFVAHVGYWYDDEQTAFKKLVGLPEDKELIKITEDATKYIGPDGIWLIVTDANTKALKEKKTVFIANISTWLDNYDLFVPNLYQAVQIGKMYNTEEKEAPREKTAEEKAREELNSDENLLNAFANNLTIASFEESEKVYPKEFYKNPACLVLVMVETFEAWEYTSINPNFEYVDLVEELHKLRPNFLNGVPVWYDYENAIRTDFENKEFVLAHRMTRPFDLRHSGLDEFNKQLFIRWCKTAINKGESDLVIDLFYKYIIIPFIHNNESFDLAMMLAVNPDGAIDDKLLEYQNGQLENFKGRFHPNIDHQKFGEGLVNFMATTPKEKVDLSMFEDAVEINEEMKNLFEWMKVDGLNINLPPLNEYDIQEHVLKAAIDYFKGQDGKFDKNNRCFTFEHDPRLVLLFAAYGKVQPI